MLGGLSGGGMGFIFEPEQKVAGAGNVAGDDCCSDLKGELQNALPLAMEPVVYDFAINERGTWADLRPGGEGCCCRRRIMRSMFLAELQGRPADPAVGTPRRNWQVQCRMPHAPRTRWHDAVNAL